MSQSNNGGMWIIVLIVIGLAALLGSINGNNTPSSTPIDQTSIEHRYVQERFKQEGYSSSEAKQAADAIIKFHNAQQKR